MHLKVADRIELQDVEGGPRAVIAEPAMLALYERIDRLADLPLPVLVFGETGVGKELIARALHDRGARADERFEAVNCGAFPDTLVESLLFGHERGTFTGAEGPKTGLVLAAGDGTLFLDEIGELPLTAQASLLRVLSEGTVRPLGSTSEQPVTARIVAATHRDLEKMCDEGTFRRDLYFRLAGITLEVPPLRERPEELELLVRHFLELTNRRYGTRVRGWTAAAMARLRRYRWPGNVRELRSVVEMAAVFADGPDLDISDLPDVVNTPRITVEPSEGDDLKSRLRRFEADQIVSALTLTGGNQTAAAERLGVPLRTLVHKIKSLGIRRDWRVASV